MQSQRRRSTILAVFGIMSGSASAMVMTSPTKSQTLLHQALELRQDRKRTIAGPALDYDSLYEVVKHRQDTWTETLFDDMSDEVGEMQELLRSTGSEVPNEELSRQIEEGRARPEAFLDAHVADASHLEKVAMSSIPEQLPRPAMKALVSERAMQSGKKLRKGIQHTNGMRLTHEEELQLARQIQAGAALHKTKTDFEAKHGREIAKQEWTSLSKLESAKELRRQVVQYRSAKQLLVEANMGLVHAVVNARYNPAAMKGISKEEMIQEGSLGLLRAAELFDPSRGLRFSTYATIWIKGILGNSDLTEAIKLPLREKTKWNKIQKSHRDLVEEMGREPTPQELSVRVGMPVEQVLQTRYKMTHAQQVFSLDYEYKQQSRSGADSNSLTSLHQDKAFMADVDLAERAQLQADVVAALATNLDAREARLMRLRYGLSDGETRSIQQCADAMGLSKTRTQQLAQGCLKKLREAQNAESLQEYLLTIA